MQAMGPIVFTEPDGEVYDTGAVRLRVLGPGSFVLVPPGVVHTFANRGATPARFLNMYQPAGNEQYLKEAMKRMVQGHPWTPTEMAEVASRYDFQPVAAEA
jgi:oxalate decarboxylase/phosphoglucose isomerase-like protein (cupin superfamily)